MITLNNEFHLIAFDNWPLSMVNSYIVQNRSIAGQAIDGDIIERAKKQIFTILSKLIDKETAKNVTQSNVVFFQSFSSLEEAKQFANLKISELGNNVFYIET